MLLDTIALDEARKVDLALRECRLSPDETREAELSFGTELNRERKPDGMQTYVLRDPHSCRDENQPTTAQAAAS